MSKSVATVAPRAVELDQSVVAPPANLASSIGEVMQRFTSSLGNMQADDLSIEIDAHSDQQRSSARVRVRAYKHRTSGRGDAS
jgi:hypothetical protein